MWLSHAQDDPADSGLSPIDAMDSGGGGLSPRYQQALSPSAKQWEEKLRSGLWGDDKQYRGEMSIDALAAMAQHGALSKQELVEAEDAKAMAAASGQTVQGRSRSTPPAPPDKVAPQQPNLTFQPFSGRALLSR
jgi:hypothetical protein